MIGESLAIVVVLLAMAFMYRRAGKKQMSFMTLPLVCVPCARLAGAAVLGTARYASSLMGYVFIISGLVAAVALSMLASTGVKSRSVRIGYLLVSFAFSGAMVIAYIMR